MGGAVSTQYFAQGEILSGTGYYYVTDQLGSIEQLVNASGTIVTQYAYDPYGNQSTVVGGTVASDLGYAGYFNHAASGLNFTRNRAYDPVHARWINRDPIGEAGGINLYAYVGGNPLTYRDPSGEFWGVVIGAGIGAIAGYEAGGYTGAAVGLVAGGITGFVAPWLSGEAATLVAGYVGGEGVASAAAAVATFEVTGVGAAAGATAITNAIQGNPIGQDIGWAVTVGALAPLASGEVGIVAAGESVVGETAANIFSGITGLWGIVGAAIDPNSSNGIITNNASCAK